MNVRIRSLIKRIGYGLALVFLTFLIGGAIIPLDIAFILATVILTYLGFAFTPVTRNKIMADLRNKVRRLAALTFR
ncbi:MAG TPA: hypothetical protein VG274_08605 [Rhizomicrobium sp.]|nr:hypothetical protein [Rhizomicrobium sp.]